MVFKIWCEKTIQWYLDIHSPVCTMITKFLINLMYELWDGLITCYNPLSREFCWIGTSNMLSTHRRDSSCGILHPWYNYNNINIKRGTFTKYMLNLVIIIYFQLFLCCLLLLSTIQLHSLGYKISCIEII
mgnify:CR=1 FL=1